MKSHEITMKSHSITEALWLDLSVDELMTETATALQGVKASWGDGDVMWMWMYRFQRFFSGIVFLLILYIRFLCFFHGNPLDLTYQESGICGFVTVFFNGIFFLKKNKELIGFWYIKNLGHMEPLFLKGSNGNLNHLDHMGEYGIRLVQQLKNHPGRDGNFIVGVFYEDIEQWAPSFKTHNEVSLFTGVYIGWLMNIAIMRICYDMLGYAGILVIQLGIYQSLRWF